VTAASSDSPVRMRYTLSTGSTKICPSPRRALSAAGEALWYYVIQREVCGLRDSEAVMRQLGVPREVRLRMGYVPRSSTDR
jgi:hypothetical protein